MYVWVGGYVCMSFFSFFLIASVRVVNGIGDWEVMVVVIVGNASSSKSAASTSSTTTTRSTVVVLFSLVH